ncbi:hypothetical protein Fmac_011480 [Flemingia macrophylla]|uniref:Uncharacterized protein n=1 Tax=Flemingia macrophylla TaxID=520843 RepID=A0ABD1MMK0_9FABA
MSFRSIRTNSLSSASNPSSLTLLVSSLCGSSLEALTLPTTPGPAFSATKNLVSSPSTSSGTPVTSPPPTCALVSLSSLFTCMNVFDVNGNMLSGYVPDFSNNSSVPVPSWNGNLFQTDNVSLPYASFFLSKVRERSLLTSMGGVGSFVVHDFGQNSFTAIQSLPIAHDSLWKKSSYTLLVGENNLSRPFPTYLFEKCDKLDPLLLNVSYNKIYGQIPSNFGGICRSLNFLDAFGNQLARPIPRDLGNLFSLVSLNISRNQLQGHISASLGQIKKQQYKLRQ